MSMHLSIMLQHAHELISRFYVSFHKTNLLLAVDIDLPELFLYILYNY